MTTGAIAFIEASGGWRPIERTFYQPQNAGNLAGIDDEQACGGIEGRSAPPRAAVETRKNNGSFAGWRLELIPEITAAQFPETPQHVTVSFRIAPGQHLFGQRLARNRRRKRRQRLRAGGLFAVYASSRNLAIFNRENRFARLALENKNVARFGDLRHSVNESPVSA